MLFRECTLLQKKNITAFNRKLELAKAGKLNEIDGPSANKSNLFITNMADAIKEGNVKNFNLLKKQFDRYQTTDPARIEKAVKSRFNLSDGGRTTSDSYDMALAYKRQQLNDPKLREGRLREGRKKMEKIREREREAKTAEDLQNFHF
jgi:hypothetical protein